MNNTIKRSKLDSLIQEIVKAVVKQIKEDKIKEMTTTGAVSPVTGPKAFKKTPEEMEETPISEMTTTGAVQGYNVPGAFTNRMNRKDRIEVLGYKMTPDGEKEYNRPGDKKL